MRLFLGINILDELSVHRLSDGEGGAVREVRELSIDQTM